MKPNVNFFKNLNKFNSYNIKFNDVTDVNFRIKTDDHLFPKFPLNEHFGLTTTLTKINLKKINEKRIIQTINAFSEMSLYDKSISGLIFFGIFEDRNKDLYVCLSSQLDQSELINFYESKALEETSSNIAVRYELLQKINDSSVSPETFINVQHEFNELSENYKYNYLYAHRHNYLKSLGNEMNYSLRHNILFLDNICIKNNLEPSGDISILKHVYLRDNFLYYFATELLDNSLIFYNLEEGFGLLQNDNDAGLLIPTVSYANTKILDNSLNLKVPMIYESSIYSRVNYNNDRFLNKNTILNNINNYAKKINLKSEIKEVNQFIPKFLYLI